MKCKQLKEIRISVNNAAGENKVSALEKGENKGSALEKGENKGENKGSALEKGKASWR